MNDRYYKNSNRNRRRRVTRAMRRRQIAQRVVIFTLFVVCIGALIFISVYLRGSSDRKVSSVSSVSVNEKSAGDSVNSGNESTETPAAEEPGDTSSGESTDTASEVTPDTIAEPEPEPEPEVSDTSLLDELYASLNITEDFLTPNEYSRPQTPLNEISGIVVHYVGNEGSTAKENRDYFEDLKYGIEGTMASSHYVIGLEGEIIQCIPLSEIAYCSNSANSYTVSIECCHPDADGKFTDATYDSLVRLCVWLCKAYNLQAYDIIRHYDVTGKTCPRYYVLNPEAWDEFRETVAYYLANY